MTGRRTTVGSDDGEIRAALVDLEPRGGGAA
jgi:hypothetical protein